MDLIDRLLGAILAATTLDESLVAFLRATALSQWIVETPWAWPVCEALHFVGLSLLIGMIAPLDIRLMGFMKGVPIAALRRLVPWAIAGFLINLVTGLLFFVGAPSQYIANSSWWLKVLFLLVAGVNILVFETIKGSRIPEIGLGAGTPAALKTIGAVSLVSWFMVLYWGRMLAFLGNAF